MQLKQENGFELEDFFIYFLSSSFAQFFSIYGSFVSVFFSSCRCLPHKIVTCGAWEGIDITQMWLDSFFICSFCIMTGTFSWGSMNKSHWWANSKLGGCWVLCLFFQFFSDSFYKNAVSSSYFCTLFSILVCCSVWVGSGRRVGVHIFFLFRVVVRDNKEGRGVVVCFVELEVSSSHYSRLYQREWVPDIVFLFFFSHQSKNPIVLRCFFFFCDRQ